MAIRSFTLEKQPTDLLIRRLQTCPTDRTTYQELCRRGDTALANRLLAGEWEDRALEKMDSDQLAAQAFHYDRTLGSSDRVSGGMA